MWVGLTRWVCARNWPPRTGFPCRRSARPPRLSSVSLTPTPLPFSIKKNTTTHNSYPLIIQDCIETPARTVDGVTIPVDTSAPNPNGVEFDNLYLVS
jgi:hypothetical protein